MNIENNTVECTVSLTLKRSFNNSKVLINVNGIEKNTELENGSYIYRDVLPINSNLKLGLLSIYNESVKEVENLNYEASVLNTVLGECYINVPWEYSFLKKKIKVMFLKWTLMVEYILLFKVNGEKYRKKLILYC